MARPGESAALSAVVIPFVFETEAGRGLTLFQARCIDATASLLSWMAPPVIQPRANGQQNVALKPSAPAIKGVRGRRQFSLRTFKRQIKSSPWQLVHLLHRLTIFGCAFYYAATSIRASVAMMEVLSGVQQFQLPTTTYAFGLIPKSMGSSSVRLSPLVQQVLGNSTSLRSDSLYLETNGTSFDACHSAAFCSDQYSNTYLRSLYAHLVEGTQHVYTDLSAMELIAPVVDCSFPLVRRGDRTRAMFFLLLRSTTDTDDVYLGSLRMSIGDYEITAQNEQGPSALVSLTLFNDTQATNLTNRFAGSLGFPYATLAFEPYTFVEVTAAGKRKLQSVPADPKTEAVKTILSTRRTGVYANTESDRSNTKSTRWKRESVAMNEISHWITVGGSTLRNSWAWGHAIHVFFAADLLFNLSVLLLLSYRALCKGKLWIGDAFVSISSTLLLRGLLILLCWLLEGFWTMSEFYLAAANEFYGVQHVLTYPELMHADLMNLYLCLLTLISYVLRDRIDPVLAMLIFEVTWQYRLATIRLHSSLTSDMMAEAKADYALGLMGMPALKAKTEPFRFWTTHEIPSRMKALAPCSIMPVVQTVVIHIVYVLIRKAYRRFHPDRLKKLVGSHLTDMSQTGQASETNAPSLTIFEIATGAPLQDSMGIVADYDTCRFIKGLKYASPDGIYSSGFVIANGRFLVATSDLGSILVMKITRWRFRNVHVFEVNGFTAKRTAQLLYPETVSWTDLVNLQLSVLS